MAADDEDDFLRMLPYADQNQESLDRILESGEIPDAVASSLKELRAAVRRQVEILETLQRAASEGAADRWRETSSGSHSRRS
jgi:hypothetical protein